VFVWALIEAVESTKMQRTRIAARFYHPRGWLASDVLESWLATRCTPANGYGRQILLRKNGQQLAGASVLSITLVTLRVGFDVMEARGLLGDLLEDNYAPLVTYFF
jgi:hypothetical protein